MSSFQIVTTNNTTTDTSANANLRVGSLVEQEKFGIGEVIAIDGVYPEAKAKIVFKIGGEKSLILKYAKLTSVN